MWPPEALIMSLFTYGLLNVVERWLFARFALAEENAESSNQVGGFLPTQLPLHPFSRFILHHRGLQPVIDQAIKGHIVLLSQLHGFVFEVVR